MAEDRATGLMWGTTKSIGLNRFSQPHAKEGPGRLNPAESLPRFHSYPHFPDVKGQTGAISQQIQEVAKGDRTKKQSTHFPWHRRRWSSSPSCTVPLHHTHSCTPIGSQSPWKPHPQPAPSSARTCTFPALHRTGPGLTPSNSVSHLLSGLRN